MMSRDASFGHPQSDTLLPSSVSLDVERNPRRNGVLVGLVGIAFFRGRDETIPVANASCLVSRLNHPCTRPKA